jgi:hypothetical protein
MVEAAEDAGTSRAEKLKTTGSAVKSLSKVLLESSR